MAEIIDLNEYRGREKKPTPLRRAQLQLDRSALLCGACGRRQWHLVLPDFVYCANCGRLADNVRFALFGQ